MAKIRISEPDWDMSDWPAEEITVGGIVMAAEGCGDDDDRAAVIDDDGRELTVLGVRRTPGRVEIVVHAPGAAQTQDQHHPEQGQAEKRYPARQAPEAETERRPGSRPARRDLTAARACVNAVTGWIAAREDSRQPDAAAVDAAVSILAAPPNHRDVSVSVHPATVWRVGGHLVAVYRFGSRVGAIATAECSCPDNRVCEHLLVALAYEVPSVDSGRRTP